MITINDKLNTFLKIAKTLNSNNISWGVGASLLLYFKGITKTFNDIDIMVSVEDINKTKNLLLPFGKLNINPINPNFDSKGFMEFVIDNIDFDVMAEFTVTNNKGSYTFPFDKSYIVEYINLDDINIPLQSVEYWLEFYKFMDRTEKVEMITNYLNN